MSYTVTGTSTSRLVELKKYKPTDNFTEKYHGNGSLSNDGVDYSQSIEGEIVVYFISGVEYNDIKSNGEWITTVKYDVVDVEDNPNFIDKRLVKNPNKSKLISNPKINNDVFIDRQEMSIFDKNYRLEFITSISDLITYAGGSYFNIVKNS